MPSPPQDRSGVDLARIVVSGTIVRYPLAGMIQWFLGWIGGLSLLGHEVYFVEKATWTNSCLDPRTGRMSQDCSYGLRVVADTLRPYGLDRRWCFVDESNRYHGLSADQVHEIFASADLFLDLEWGEWLPEAAPAGLKVVVDGEPGWLQIKLELGSPDQIPAYDVYYTVGLNVGTSRSSAPTAGIRWRHTQSPVLLDADSKRPPSEGGSYVSVMNWRSHKTLTYDGITYGQKDLEFPKFIHLPQATAVPWVLAVAGDAPRARLEEEGWSLIDPFHVTETIRSYRRFLENSRGYLAIAKHVRVATNAGWFGDAAGYSLATGRPVIHQDNGLAGHLPSGRGLFLVRDLDEAAEAVAAIEREYDEHSEAAHAIARDHLDARLVLRKLLDDLGVR